MKLSCVCFLLISFLSVTTYSQNKDVSNPARVSKKSLDTSKALQINYFNPRWNTNSTKIDLGMLILRDKNSGQIVRLELQENAPDSSMFEGVYVIKWANPEGLLPEVYSTQDLVAPKGQPLNIKTLIETKALQRKPYIVTKDDNNLPTISVFESRSDAEAALKKYNEQNIPDTKEQPVPTAAKSVLEAGKLANAVGEKRKLELDARKRETERQQIEAAEKEKAAQRLREQQVLSEEAKKKNKKDAQAFAEAAMDSYRVNQFKQAEEYFEKSVVLDPENKAYYYQYGVTLYRNEKYNQSLVYLKLADGKDFDVVERDFYLGLNHYKLKEYPRALAAFKKVEATKHDPLGPSASFYIGLVNFADLKYENAKEAFQRSLDTSNDPKLDERSEEYIEKIERLIYFEKNKAKKFIVGLSFGPQYDSNVLLVSEATSAAGAGASSEGSVRYNTGASLFYRPLYEKTYELGVKAKTDYVYTAETTLDDYDSWLTSATVPVVFKGVAFGKGLKAEFIPGVEKLYVGQDSGGAPNESLNSVAIDSLNTLVMSENWFTSVNLKYHDDTYTNAWGSNAKKWTFGLGNTFFLNKNKTQAGVFDLAYTTNPANADTSKYTKVDMSATYLTTWVWDLQVIAGLAVYTQSYALQTPTRDDTNITASVTLARPLNDWLKAMWNTAYISNTSTASSSTYKKYISGITLSGEYQF